MSVIDEIRDGVVGWANEFRCACTAGPLEPCIDDIVRNVSRHDVCIFTKPGCGYCAKAMDALTEAQNHPLSSDDDDRNRRVKNSSSLSSDDNVNAHTALLNNDSTSVSLSEDKNNAESNNSNRDMTPSDNGEGAFGFHEVKRASESPMRFALQKAIGFIDISFPVVVVRGCYIGGADELCELIASSRSGQSLPLEKRVAFKPGHVVWHASLGRGKWMPKLCTPPRGQRWGGFQRYAHANVVRVFFGLLTITYGALYMFLLLTEPDPVYDMIVSLTLVLLSIELMMFTVNGMSPMCGIGNLSRIIAHRFHGPVVDTLVYKALAMIYVTATYATGAIVCAGGFGYSCDRGSLPEIMLVCAINSSMLAILRF